MAAASLVVLLLISLQVADSCPGTSSNISPRQSCILSQILKLILQIVQCELNNRESKINTSKQLSPTQALGTTQSDGNESNSSSTTYKTVQSPADLCSAKSSDTGKEVQQPQLSTDRPPLLLSSSDQLSDTQVLRYPSAAPVYLVMDEGVIRKSSVPFGFPPVSVQFPATPQQSQAEAPKYQLFQQQNSESATSVPSSVPDKQSPMLFTPHEALPVLTMPLSSVAKETNGFTDTQLSPITLYRHL